MKKFISLISAAVFSATLVLPQTLAFSAAAEESALEESTVFDAAAAEANPFQATGTANTLPYQLRFVPERNFVTAEEVAAGDVVNGPLTVVRAVAGAKLAVEGMTSYLGL